MSEPENIKQFSEDLIKIAMQYKSKLSAQDAIETMITTAVCTAFMAAPSELDAITVIMESFSLGIETFKDSKKEKGKQ